MEGRAGIIRRDGSPALADEGFDDLRAVAVPPLAVARVKVIGPRRQPPSVVDRYGLGLEPLRLLDVVDREAWSGTDDDVIARSFFLESSRFGAESSSIGSALPISIKCCARAGSRSSSPGSNICPPAIQLTVKRILTATDFR